MTDPLIILDPDVQMGKPIIAQTRLTVEFLLEELAAGTSVDQLLRAHPRLTKKAISAALSFAALRVRTDPFSFPARRSA